MLLALTLLACSEPEAPPVPVEPPKPAAEPAVPPPPDPTAAPGTRIVGDGNIPGSNVVAKPGEEPKYYVLLGAVEGIVFSGDWTSPSCGGRKFPRNIRFEEDHTWNVVELLDPCKPGTKCENDGLTHYGGTWRHDGGTVFLSSMNGEGSSRPQSFTATTNGRLVENECVYVRGLSVPEGYKEADVRPSE